MSKSLGNIVRVADALEKYSPETLRLWITSTHYRKPLDYNEKDLEVAKNRVAKIMFTLQKIKENIDKATGTKPLLSKQLETLEKQFFNAMKDDMNTPLALTNFFRIISLTNKRIDTEKFSKKDLQKAEKIILELGEFFQIIPELREEKLPEEIEQLIREREEAREKKNWVEADAIRTQIRKLGYILEDTTEGVKWRKIKG
jgi:cysteinyl-tRNA synthetase